MGPRSGLDRCGKSRPPTGIRSPDRPPRSSVTIPTELPVDSIGENFFFFVKFFSSNFAEIHPTGLRSPDRPARSSVTILTELPVDSIAEKFFFFEGGVKFFSSNFAEIKRGTELIRRSLNFYSPFYLHSCLTLL